MKKELKLINAVVLAIVTLLYLSARNLVFTNNEKQTANDFFLVTKVVDGDTINLSDGRKVRLIGVDTPEVGYSKKLLRDSKKSGQSIKTIQALGRKASDFAKKLYAGKRVRLEYDVEGKDRYGRTLAYVYLNNGLFVNAELIKEGYAQVMTVTPNVKFSDYFLKLQKEAREAKRGLWKD